jgi:CRISPR-associated exonuclease Cas4
MEPLPLSLLNDFLYCRRRAALKGIEGLRSANVHTAQGDIFHKHADLPGYDVANGVTLLRALPVFSERPGLSGKCDIVEVYRGDGARADPGPASAPPHGVSYRPVEYKKGPRRRFDNDDAQLCAQALCLEEMFGVPVEGGAVFHAASKHRREVAFTPDLRRMTEEGIAELRAMVESGQVPPAEFKPQCEECSLFEICLPAATSLPDRLRRELEALYQT